MTRRSFVASMSAVAAVPPAWLATGVARAEPNYLFFDAAEAAFIEPACARLLSPETAAGDLGIHVTQYLDGHLAGPWGAGQRAYRPGPWQPGTGAPGIAAAPPAILFRRALQAINRGFAHQRTSFRTLDAAAQLAYLRLLDCNAVALDGVPSALFFQLLLGMTVEGFFTRVPLAQHCAVIAWPLKGFPGAYFQETGVGVSAL